jgi:hypothetical protein
VIDPRVLPEIIWEEMGSSQWRGSGSLNISMHSISGDMEREKTEHSISGDMEREKVR